VERGEVGEDGRGQWKSQDGEAIKGFRRERHVAEKKERDRGLKGETGRTKVFENVLGIV